MVSHWLGVAWRSPLGVSHWLPIGPSTKSLGSHIIQLPAFPPTHTTLVLHRVTNIYSLLLLSESHSEVSARNDITWQTSRVNLFVSHEEWLGRLQIPFSIACPLQAALLPFLPFCRRVWVSSLYQALRSFFRCVLVAHCTMLDLYSSEMHCHSTTMCSDMFSGPSATIVDFFWAPPCLSMYLSLRSAVFPNLHTYCHPFAVFSNYIRPYGFFLTTFIHLSTFIK